MKAGAARLAESDPITIGIAIGHLPLSVRTDDAVYAAMIERRYANFLCPANRARATLEVTIVPPPATVAASDIEVRREGACWQIRRGDFSATWDPVSRRGTIVQSANPYSTDTAIRIIHSLSLAANHGLLIHAASAIRAGRSFVLPGVSGAGKTTMARLAPPDTTLLTDEISYLQLIRGQYRAFGTPFSGELDVSGANTSAPIAGVYFLTQGRDNRRNALTAGEALRRLLRNVLFFSTDAGLTAQVLETACALLDNVPSYELVFTPDRRVWELLR